MNDITITTTDRINVTSPYNPEFVKDAKHIGGKWDAAKRAWTFDPRDKTRVDDLLAKHYGYTPDNLGETVTIRVKAGDCYDNRTGSLIAAGRIIARRTARDLPVRLADNVIVVSGEFEDRGGSRKNPYVSWDDDSEPVLEIRDLPKGVVDMLDKPYELVDTDPKRMLREERERLVKRLAEIDRLLND